MRPLELLQRLLDSLVDDLLLLGVEVPLELHQDGRHERRHLVGIGVHARAQTEHAAVVRGQALGGGGRVVGRGHLGEGGGGGAGGGALLLAGELGPHARAERLQCES